MPDVPVFACNSIAQFELLRLDVALQAHKL